MIKLRMTAQVKKQLKQIDRMFLPYQIKYGVKYRGKDFVNTLNNTANILYGTVVELNEDSKEGYSYDFLKDTLERYYSHLSKSVVELSKYMTDKELELFVAPLMPYQPRNAIDEFRESFIQMTKIIITDIHHRLLNAVDFMENFCSFATIFSEWWVEGVKAQQAKQLKEDEVNNKG